ncbi:MAG TPA: glycoside hydrolase family 76 protein [Actinophytocola sp.]|uniref:glycoside hydrolase family 76 protein n=1 Tax=Actinophytocola sp. TaxID=1872138 RepID=UPI002DBF740B|nr:glycoside hydrolase family 76 protein [Actinophytocola sp.]HEU5473008.1 glycoside hydrolase family 76 protein [Actinophytocola sp.]
MRHGAERAESAGAHDAAQPWAERAAVAEQAVVTRHLRRVWAIPGTQLGVRGWPVSMAGRLHTRWNYWWQAHLLDCLTDAQLRDPQPARAARIGRLVRGLRMRNFGSWINDYYDDIAWLGLALLRASEATGVPVDAALRPVAARLREGWTDHGGGGIWWRRKDDFKNVPANGPGAILLARWSRAGGERTDLQRARSMTEWIERYLLDQATGLVWDGMHVNPDGTIRDIERTVYTYCQGVFLGACLELAAGDRSGVWVGRAERTVGAVAERVAEGGVLPGQGAGDGGLFAGILARYLALAALRLPLLGSTGGAVAAGLVFGSAEAAWRNRALARGGPLFGPEWSQPAVSPRSPRDPRLERDLSVQLGGWMLVEAAALLERTL